MPDSPPTATASTVALLAPVPLAHLIAGGDVVKKNGKVAFGSRAWNVFRQLDALREGLPVDVWIYASHAQSSGPPKATWRARYIGTVDAVGGGSLRRVRGALRAMNLARIHPSNFCPDGPIGSRPHEAAPEL